MKRILWLVMVALMFFVTIEPAEAVIDITGLSIQELHELVDQELLTYEAITKVYLDRIETLGPEYKAIISVNEAALEEARLLDEEYREKGRRSKIHGMPILVKDNIDVKGMPTTAGAKGLLNNFPKKDAEVIKRMRQAGAIIIAKANMDEFSFNASVSRSSFGTVLNAYNKLYSSYGSSGGTAVGVALDLAVAGLGTDTGTSVRIPASANHLIGHRPTKSQIPMDGIIAFESYRDVVGPIAKRSEEAQIIYEIIAEEKVEAIEPQSLIVGVYMPALNKSPSYIQDLFKDKVELLREAKVPVKMIKYVPLYYDFDASNMCYEFNQYIKGTVGPVQSLRDLIKTGQYTQSLDYLLNYDCENDYKKTDAYKHYVDRYKKYEKDIHNSFINQGIDVLIYPTMSTPLYSLEEVQYNELIAFGSEIPPQAGFPGMNIPMGFHNGLPYGLEAVALKDQDHKLYALADLISETYKLPEGADALYEISPRVDEIIDLVNQDHATSFDEVINSMELFIRDYHLYEFPEREIDKLLRGYQQQIQRNKRIKKSVLFIGSLALFWLIKRKK